MATGNPKDPADTIVIEMIPSGPNVKPVPITEDLESETSELINL